MRDKPVICVINRLGKKCETTTIGETIASTDTYGNPNTKKTSEGQGMRQRVVSTGSQEAVFGTEHPVGAARMSR